MSNPNFPELASRDRIIRVAAVLFAERGYHAVGVNDICEAVGLSRGALYHHIDSKEEILDEICSSYMTQLGVLARHTIEHEANPEIQLQKLGHDLIDIIARHKAELTVCFREIQSLTGERRERVLGLHAVYERIWADVLKAGAKMGRFRAYSKSRLKGLLGMYYYSYIWIQPENRPMIKESTDTLHDIVLKAVLTHSEPPAAKRAARKSRE